MASSVDMAVEPSCRPAPTTELGFAVRSGIVKRGLPRGGEPLERRMTGRSRLRESGRGGAAGAQAHWRHAAGGPKTGFYGLLSSPLR